MAALEEDGFPFFPLSFCKDLSDHLTEVLAHENTGLLAGRAVYDFFAEYAAVHHRFAVDLAKACKAARVTLNALPQDGGSNFVKTCMAVPSLVMQLSQSHMATLNQVTRDALKPAEKYDMASRERHQARKEEVTVLSKKLEEHRRRLDESRAFVNQTLAKLSKTNIQKDKKAWLRRRNKTIDRLEEYKANLTTANSVATDLRLNEASSLLMRMHEEEERRVNQLQNTLSMFATVTGGHVDEVGNAHSDRTDNVEAISFKLQELARNLNPVEDMTHYIYDNVTKRKRELAVKAAELREVEKTMGEKEELTSLSASLTRRAPPPPPPSPAKRASMTPSSSSGDLKKETTRIIIARPSEPEVGPLSFHFAYEINTPKELWGAVSERSSKQSGMFFSSLEGVMEHQERCFPCLHRMHHDTPIILDVLLKASNEFGEGLQTKGICTLSEDSVTPSAQDRLLGMQIQTLREQYESGNFRFAMGSALIPAALLQRWLLELAEPLIPSGAYVGAVDMISECTDEEIQERLSGLVSKLPALHWRVLSRVLGFIVSVEQAANGMSRQLLAASFAPCLLRSQSTSRNAGSKPSMGAEFVELLLAFFTSPAWQATEVGRDELAQDLALYSGIAEVKHTMYATPWDEQLSTCRATNSRSGSMTPRASVSCCLTPGCFQRKLRRGYCLNHVKAYLQQHTRVSALPPPIKVDAPSFEKRWSTPSPVDSSNREKRMKVLEELKNSEQTYVASLKLLQEKWVNALEKPTDERWIKAMAGVTHSELGFMTDHLTTLANFHTIFLAEFEKDLEHAPSVFLSYAAYFKMYSSYMNSFDLRLATLNRLRASNKKFAVYVKHIEDSLKAGGLNLASYLIMPVQRIPRYVLLLKELTKNTPPDHPEYRNHLMALEKVKAIAVHINSAKADAEALAKLMQVQYKIPNCPNELVQPHRQIVREGVLNVVSTSKRLLSSGKPKPRYVFLFNDMLLWINEVNNTMKGKIMLTSATSATQLENFDLEIASNNEVFVARIVDATERKTWLDSFQDVIRQQKFIYANKRTALNRRTTNAIHQSVPRSSQSGSEAPSVEVSLISVTELSTTEISRVEGDCVEAKSSIIRPKRTNSFSSAMDFLATEESDSDAADPLMIRTSDHWRADSSSDLSRTSNSPVKTSRERGPPPPSKRFSIPPPSTRVSSMLASSTLHSSSTETSPTNISLHPLSEVLNEAKWSPSSNSVLSNSSLGSCVHRNGNSSSSSNSNSSSGSNGSSINSSNRSRSSSNSSNSSGGSNNRYGSNGGYSKSNGHNSSCIYSHSRGKSPNQVVTSVDSNIVGPAVNLARSRSESTSFRPPIRPSSLTIPDSPAFRPSAPLRPPPPRVVAFPSPDLPLPPPDFPPDFIPPPPPEGSDSESDHEPLPPPDHEPLEFLSEPTFPPSPSLATLRVNSPLTLTL